MMLSSRVSEFIFLAILDSNTWLSRWLRRVLTCYIEVLHLWSSPSSMVLLKLLLCSSLCIPYIAFAFVTCSMLASIHLEISLMSYANVA